MSAMGGAGQQVEPPAEALARRIVERLVAEGLIGAGAADGLRPKLADGTLKDEDWSLPIEIELAKEGDE